MMNMGGWAVGRAGVNISFPVLNSATLRNILKVHSRIIEQVNVLVESHLRNISVKLFCNFFVIGPLAHKVS